MDKQKIKDFWLAGWKARDEIGQVSMQARKNAFEKWYAEIYESMALETFSKLSEKQQVEVFADALDCMQENRDLTKPGAIVQAMRDLGLFWRG